MNPNRSFKKQGCGSGRDVEENGIWVFTGAFGRRPERGPFDVRRLVEGEKACILTEITGNTRVFGDGFSLLELYLCLGQRSLELATSVCNVVLEKEGLLIFL